MAMRRILNERGRFEDKQYFQRKEILTRVIERWEELTGEQPTLDHVTGPFKRCIAMGGGQVPFVPLGHYGKCRYVAERTEKTVFSVQSSPRTIASKPQRGPNQHPAPRSQTPSQGDTSRLPDPPDWVREQWLDDGPAKRNLGEGSFRVYAWCQADDAKSDHRWPIKVGYTGKGGLKSRIDRSQMKEPPDYLICMRFETEVAARSMERALHICLEFRNRQTPDSLGREWFRTAPK